MLITEDTFFIIQTFKTERIYMQNNFKPYESHTPAETDDWAGIVSFTIAATLMIVLSALLIIG